MRFLDLINLTALMELTSDRSEIIVGLIDGPVVTSHPDLASENIREIPGGLGSSCARTNSAACVHGTFVAGILCAKRNSPAPAICPNCTLLVRPIFAETASENGALPSATPEELATAIIDCIEANARAINLSVALAQPSSKGQRKLEEALDHASRRGVILVAAAGNQGTLGSSVITRHQWVIPVVACDDLGRPKWVAVGMHSGRVSAQDALLGQRVRALCRCVEEHATYFDDTPKMIRQTCVSCLHRTSGTTRAPYYEGWIRESERRIAK